MVIQLAQITSLIDKGKEKTKTKSEASDSGPVVTEVDIQHIVSSGTGIPVDKVSSDESNKLLKMEDTLHQRIIGQDEAVKAISRAICRARVVYDINVEEWFVTEVDIPHIVSSWTGIPVDKVSSDESDKLLKMEDTLHQRIIGQDEAVKAISRAIRRACVGLKNPNRPITSFIFSGPIGVGKSELAKTLATYYFGSEEAMIRLDMSEFMERHLALLMISSPPVMSATPRVVDFLKPFAARPYLVVLFDEIEGSPRCL
ncbi:hypothetical protein IFM89_005094 [Coptis chinensis]|uniref:ATPase AAA-type core domain-containing protein n=1 Tax=Coptis chinensis TaxID=261450 RepID=A0A835IJL4_9MAGN|nr:hypothetical protein IFM89_005094 [Coptis chinensis]